MHSSSRWLPIKQCKQRIETGSVRKAVAQRLNKAVTTMDAQSSVS
ncbi:hypothetical protein [Symbiopectobacterium purcellii]|nr:hypothetical protein [Symbiopectobacterium purcellii]